MISSILIANRGEIACRIIRTCQKNHIRSIAIYAEADKDAMHVKMADEAYCLATGTLQDTYLNIEKIIEIAQSAKVDAIHPGYGFLSENPHFAKTCQTNNICFIGPNPDAIELMAIKDASLKTMQSAGIPTTPGAYDLNDMAEFEKAAQKIGYPVLVKAAAGGGGKGMRKVYSEKELAESVRQAKQESLNAFGNDTLFMEKYLEGARHIEVQVFRDTHQNCVHLFERDCSSQRRHQKIIEEAPAKNLSEDFRQKLYQAAINAAEAIDYIGAGTIEFLVSAKGEFYFMEMNTRLQVEHPVTELITGLDLVEWQIIIASGQAIPLKQEQIRYKGHAIEARIYSEDPKQNFLPQVGTIQAIFSKNAPFTRVDSGVQTKDTLSIHYDPMISKVICWGETREQAIERLLDSLSHYAIIGVKNNIHFAKAILSSEAFKSILDIQYIEKHTTSFIQETPKPDASLWAIACLIQVCLREKETLQQKYSPWSSHHCFRMNLVATESMRLVHEKQSAELKLHYIAENHIRLSVDNQSFDCQGHVKMISEGQNFYSVLRYQMNTRKQSVVFFQDVHHQTHILYQGNCYIFENESSDLSHSLDEEDENVILSPMPGLITQIWAQKNKEVHKGEKIMALEAMKMEHTVSAPKDGKIKEINFKKGDQVNEGALLVELH